MPHAQDSVWMEGKKYAWKTWGEILKPKPETKVWGTFQGDFYAGKPAVISRKLGKGTVTYIGIDSNDGLLETEVLKKLYAQLAIPVENYPEGVSVEYRDGFGIAVNYSDKIYNLKFPANAQILTGKKELSTASVTVWKLK
jgi:beta-galactosidase